MMNAEAKEALQTALDCGLPDDLAKDVKKALGIPDPLVVGGVGFYVDKGGRVVMEALSDVPCWPLSYAEAEDLIAWLQTATGRKE